MPICLNDEIGPRKRKGAQIKRKTLGQPSQKVHTDGVNSYERVQIDRPLLCPRRASLLPNAGDYLDRIHLCGAYIPHLCNELDVLVEFEFEGYLPLLYDLICYWRIIRRCLFSHSSAHAGRTRPFP